MTGLEILLVKCIVGGMAAGTTRAVASHALRRPYRSYYSRRSYYPTRYR